MFYFVFSTRHEKGQLKLPNAFILQKASVLVNTLVSFRFIFSRSVWVINMNFIRLMDSGNRYLH